MPDLHRIILSLLFVSTIVPNIHAADLPQGILAVESFAAPRIELTDLDGKPFSLTDAKHHWLFVHFWASWCGPCRKEMPAIQQMWHKMEQHGLKIALINTAEDEDTVFSFLSVHAPEIRPLLDRDGQTTEAWQPRGLPATYLVDPSGMVRYQALGGRPWDTEPYLQFLQQLLR